VTNWDKHAELDKRIYHSAKEFDEICSRYAGTYGRFGWKATVRCIIVVVHWWVRVRVNPDSLLCSGHRNKETKP